MIRNAFKCAAMMLALCGTAAATDRVLFRDDFESGLARWEILESKSAMTADSGDLSHRSVFVLRPQGDAYALIKGSERWGPVRIEGEVLFPTSGDSYLGVLYNFQRRGQRTDFGNIYIKGNDSNLIVNPHRDFNVGRTLYEEYRTPLTGSEAIQPGRWYKFKAEVVGPACHFYVGDVAVPQLIFPFLELSSGSIGLQPRSVGDDVWVDNVVVTSIDRFSYTPSKPTLSEYQTDSLLTDWKVAGPYARTKDGLARKPDAAGPIWRPFAVDARGAVVTGKVVDYHGPNTVAYFRTFFEADRSDVSLHVSTIDDLAIWINGRFHWFVPRRTVAWHDFWKYPEHKGQRIPLGVKAGRNEIVIRIRGGVYASGGFFARIEDKQGGIGSLPGNLPQVKEQSAQTNQQLNDAYVKQITADLGDRVNEPAVNVFKNMRLEWLKDVPAGRFLSIMKGGYSRALGVSCSHCHNVKDFSSDEKRPKRAAREMADMHRMINQHLLKLKELQSDAEARFINCNTCHRGNISPNTQQR